jgi:thiol:disulfide interchange protein
MYMFRKAKKMLDPTHLPKALVLLLIVVLVLYFYFKYSKEGFECKPDELESMIHTSEPTLVLFYADWCGHCTKLKPTWDETAAQANADKTRMIKIDVGGKTSEQKEIMDRYQIDGFPTILVFQNGNPTPYQGARTVDAFLNALGN